MNVELPDAVLWDMDGTILDSEKLWDVALVELANHLGRKLTGPLRRSLVGGAAGGMYATLIAAWELDPSSDNRTYIRQWLQRRIAQLYAQPLPWRPGAKDALGLVRDAGLAAALVTNTQRALTEYGLDAIGRGYFDATVCGDEVGVGKPAPDGYRRAAQLLGVSPERCVAIEDSVTGVTAAEAAGCGLIVVPCAAPVPEKSGRVYRADLTGFSLVDLRLAMAVRIRR